MRTHIFEAQSRQGNWGKFLVGEMDTEWEERSVLGDRARPLLTQCGWAPGHLWVMDMQTFEGAAFRHGGHAKADLDRHRIWVCPLFEPFLTWLYTQDAARLGELDQLVTLDAPLALAGYRRSGGTDEVEQALYAADSGQTGDWTMVAWILADKVRELQADLSGGR